MYPKELKIEIQADTCILVFIAKPLHWLFTVAKRWKQPNCSSRDEWINKMWFIHANGILVSHVKEGSSDRCYDVNEP